MKKIALLLPLLCLAACGGNYKHPTFSNPHSMSSDTLCYRYATAKKDQNIKDEVAARHLDCDAILENDPLYR